MEPAAANSIPIGLRMKAMLTEVSNEYSNSSGRFPAPTSFMGDLKQGHWSGSAPQTLRMRSRQRGAWSGRIVACCFEEGSGGRMIRTGMSRVNGIGFFVANDSLDVTMKRDSPIPEYSCAGEF